MKGMLANGALAPVDLSDGVGAAIVMRAEGLEPPRLAPPAPKAGVSTNFTTPAREGSLGAEAVAG